MPSESPASRKMKPAKSAGFLFSEYNSAAMRPSAAIGIFIAFALAAAHSQSPSISGKDTQQTAVRVALTVKNEHKEFVKPLQRDQVSVKVDRRPVLDFELTDISTQPLQLCLVLDNSGSSRRESKAIDGAFRGAMALMKLTMRKGRDYGCLVDFGETAHIDQEWTDDPALIAKTAQRKFAPLGRTAIYDSVAATCAHFDEAVQPAPRRILLLATDGGDNASKLSQKEATTICQLHQVAIIVVDTHSGDDMEPPEIGGLGMQLLARHTGGEYYTPVNDKEMIAAYEEIVARVSAMQELSFAIAKGSKSKLEVKATSSKWAVSAPDAVIATH